MSRTKERRYASARTRVEQRGAGFGLNYLKLPEGVERFEPKAGKYTLDILSYRVGEGNPYADPDVLFYERTFWVHRGIGPNNQSFLCAAKTLSKRCCICDHRMDLRKSGKGNAETEKQIKALAPKERQIFNLVNKAEPEKKVQIFEFSTFLFGEKLDNEINAADEDENLDLFHSYDSKHGQSLRVMFEGDSFEGNQFVKAVSIQFKPRQNEYEEEEWLKKVLCLDDLLVETPQSKLKSIFLQDDSGDDDDLSKKTSEAAKPVVEEDKKEDPPKKSGKKPAPSAQEKDWGDFDDPPKKGRFEPEPGDDPGQDGGGEDDPPKKPKARFPRDKDPKDPDEGWDD